MIVSLWLKSLGLRCSPFLTEGLGKCLYKDWILYKQIKGNLFDFGLNVFFLPFSAVQIEKILLKEISASSWEYSFEVRPQAFSCTSIHGFTSLLAPRSVFEAC